MAARYRIRELPKGNFAIDIKKHWWSPWREEGEWGVRASTLTEAIERARRLANPRIVSHAEIFGTRF